MFFLVALCSYFSFLFYLLKNEANKIDLLREKLKIILEGDGLVLANEVCITYALFFSVLFLNFQVSGSHSCGRKIVFNVYWHLNLLIYIIGDQ